MRKNDSVLINALLNPDVYNHKVDTIELIETHISWVILTGHFAYKIKKPVNFGFLDFSTLERRHFYCQEELRLNKRLAPQIYLDVIHITGQIDNPIINGDGPVIEYAVKMLQFPQSAQFDRLLAAGRLNKNNMTNLAEVIADFHVHSPVASQQTEYGSIDSIKSSVMENFIQIKDKDIHRQERLLVEELQQWSEQFLARHGADFILRKQQQAIRECHGDMHLRNIALVDGQSVLFDCLEFNDEFRWIDVMSELAFLCMDIENRGRIDLSQILLNRYLEISGDYHGLALFRFYKVYRALVRAKVDVLRMFQSGIGKQQRQQIYAEFSGYLQLARKYVATEQPVMYITHGLSGSGKTTGTNYLMNNSDVIRVRSDVERKRLFGIAETHQDSGHAANSYAMELNRGIYSAEAGTKTYDYLYTLADSILESGYSVIVDACFLKYSARRKFHLLADHHSVAFVILSFDAPVKLLKQRLAQRQCIGEDASDADIHVLEGQLNSDFQLLEYEKNYCYTVKQDSNYEADILKYLSDNELSHHSGNRFV